jgi:putative hydrolase of the HAD superfamily
VRESGGLGAGYPRAFLVDVFDTILTCDFDLLRTELPVLAGVEPQVWNRAFASLRPDLTRGRLSMAQGFELILQACNVTARPGLVSELVSKDRDLLSASSRLYPDAIPFLQSLRSMGCRIALVSNCAENTRQLLSGLGVSELADAVVLSCEVGCAKPDARIYRHALGLLGVRADAAVLVDDQPAYCAGAVAAGMTALQIIRETTSWPPVPPGVTVIRSLAQAVAMLSARSPQAGQWPACENEDPANGERQDHC